MADEDKYFEDEDIGADAPSEKNWKGIIIAVLVICFVLGMIITSVLLLTPPDLGPRVRGERITLEQILGDDFKIREFNGSWISGKEFVFRNANGGISIFNAEETSSRVIVSNVTVHQLNVDGFNVSADHKYVLLSEKVQKLHQYSYTSKYHIYDVVTLHPKPLTHQPEERGHPDLVYAKWSTAGSALVMVDVNFNIFYKKTALGSNVYQLTDSGKAGVIYNGAPDWVYETEILGDHFATWFSPNGEKLAYATFNDTNVEELPIVYYGRERQYSTLNSVKYPKAGQTNPSVTLWVLDLTSDLRTQLLPRDVKPPNGVKDQLVTSSLWDHYFTSLIWVDNSTLSIVWMNRAQNVSIITLCRPPLYFCEATHMETAHHGWVDLYEAPIFSSDGQSYLVRLPVRNGDDGEFKHLNLYNTRLHMVNPITHGAYEVTKILGWDHDSNFIFFMGTSVDAPGERHLYRIAGILSSAIARTPDCVSCFEAENSTEKCLFNKAHMSKDYSYFVLECLGPDVPRTYLYSTWDLEQRFVLNNYDDLRELVGETALPEVKTFKVELEVDSPYTANVQLLLPPGLREDEITTYPIVIHAFGSPGSQSVDSQMRFHYGTYLASKRDIIYALIDGRGTGFQGDKIKHEVFLNLGDKEVMDLLAVVRYLKENLHFIDEKRIVLWGSNYGGYITTMALAKDAEDMFSCGIAVSPITRWENYNSVFTERYMGSPHAHPGSNYKGYESGDVTKVAGNIKNSKLLMVHGTADRKVPFSHTMMLTKALMHEGITFKQIIYPDEGNSLDRVREHLYVSMDRYMSDCFRPSIEELYFHIKKKKDLEEIGYL